jgi:hypothetical protein
MIAPDLLAERAYAPLDVIGREEDVHRRRTAE